MTTTSIQEAQDQWKVALEVSASWNSVVNRRREAWKAAQQGPAADKARRELKKALDQLQAAKTSEIAAWSVWVDARDEAA